MAEPKETAEAPDEFDALRTALRERGVPEDFISAIPEMKRLFGKFRVAYLGDNVYVYKRLNWGEMKDITNRLSVLAKSPNASEASLRIADLEYQLEKAVLYPKITVETASRFPSGDLETLQSLVTEFSGYVDMEPVIEDY
jgi:hypothetical protein